MSGNTPVSERPLEDLGPEAISHEILLTAFCHELAGHSPAFAKAISGRLQALLDRGDLAPMVRKRLEGFLAALLDGRHPEAGSGTTNPLS